MKYGFLKLLYPGRFTEGIKLSKLFVHVRDVDIAMLGLASLTPHFHAWARVSDASPSCLGSRL